MELSIAGKLTISNTVPLRVIPTPGAPVLPISPLSPLSPLGIVNAKTAFVVLPVFITDANVPAFPVVVEPTVAVAQTPVSPFGIIKFKIALDVVPAFEILTSEPAIPVDTLPTVIVAAAHHLL